MNISLLPGNSQSYKHNCTKGAPEEMGKAGQEAGSFCRTEISKDSIGHPGPDPGPEKDVSRENSEIRKTPEVHLIVLHPCRFLSSKCRMVLSDVKLVQTD